MRKRVAFFVLGLACLAGFLPVACGAGGLSARLPGVSRFVSPVNAGGVPAKLCWATGAALPVRVEGSNLVADPGSLSAGEQVCAFDGPFRLGSGEVGADGSLALSLGYAPGGPVAVLGSASPVPAGWMPYSWERLASGPAGRFRPGLAYAGGKVHVFGGSAYGPLPAGQVWALWDLASGAWSYPGGNVPPQRYAHAMAASPDGRVWVFGGDLGFQCYPSGFGSDLWVYLEGAGWQKLQPPSAPPARAWTRGVWLGGKFWVFGGRGAAGTLNDLWAYDPAPGAWEQRAVSSPDKPAPRYVHAMAACGGRIYVHGGSQVISNTGVPVPDLWAYDPASDAWTRRADGPALYDHEMVAVGGLLYTFGGGTSSSGSTTADVWVYDPARDAWNRLSKLGTWPAGRYSHGMCAGPDGSIYVFGAFQTGVWQEFWRLRPGFVAPCP